jgi:phosphoglycerate-specific signal transduction histidine kinase
MMNLIINAIDAMKNVEGTRELVIKSQRQEDEQLVLAVSDTGVGLPRQQADQIFNAFFTTRATGLAWAFRSAALSLNRMEAACGLPTTLRVAQAFTSRYPPNSRPTNEARRAVLEPTYQRIIAAPVGLLLTS